MGKCKCCGHNNEGQLCEYCGFIEPSFSDIASSESNTLDLLIAEHKKSKEYRETVLSHTSISIMANRYQWNPTTNQYEQKGSIELYDPKPDGTTCFAQTVYSKEWIAHFEGKAEVKVHYSFGNQSKDTSAKLNLSPQEGIWYLGLHINESLQLEIWLRVKSVDGNQIVQDKLLDKVDLDFHE